MRPIIHILFILLFLNISSKAQDENRVSASAFEGTHFYIGFMENEIEIQGDNTPIYLRTYITSKYRAKVTVKTYVSENIYFIDPDEILELFINKEFEVKTNETPINRSIEITSDAPVLIYNLNSAITTSDAYTALPVRNWGNEYVILSYPNDQYTWQEQLDSLIRFKPRLSEFMIIANEDDTEVQYKPTGFLLSGRAPDQWYSATLRKGQCYLVQAYDFEKGMGDLTGSIVRSNKPVGVFSGHMRTAIPQFLPMKDNKDHLVEMLPPTSSWGRNYVSVPFLMTDQGDVFRVTCINPNTVVTLENPYTYRQYTLNNPGDWFEIDKVSESTVWSSNEPIQIGQFMAHSDKPDPRETYFDPAYVVLLPIEQFVNRINFQTMPDYVFNVYGFEMHFVSLVIENSAWDDIKIDGKLIKNHPDLKGGQNLPNTTFRTCNLIISGGTHTIESPSGKFSGAIYGISQLDSYAMILGSSLDNPYKDDFMPPTITANEECGRVKGVAFEDTTNNNSGIYWAQVIQNESFNYEWNISEIKDTSRYFEFEAWPKNIFQDGKFAIEIRDKNGNGKKYEFEYFRINVILPQKIDFGYTLVSDSICKVISIVNTGETAFSIDSLFLTATIDPRLAIYSQFPLPYLIKPGDSTSVTVCFKPNGDNSKLNDRLKFFFNCNREYELPIEGLVDEPDLAARGYDFGKILVGNDSCSKVWIYNTGNSNIQLLGLDGIYESVLWIDTAGVFPINLVQGDSLGLNACFLPTSRGDFEQTFVVNSSKKITASIVIKGIGIRPQFDPIVIDWSNRRIGSPNDSSFEIINYGNASSILKLLAITGNNDNFELSQFDNFEKNFLPDESKEFTFSYIPIDEQNHRAIAEFEVDWAPHGNVKFEFIGKGTIPTIKTFDIEFDTTVVFKQRDTNEVLIRAGGSENLRIFFVKILEGDYESFDLDLDRFIGLRVDHLNSMSDVFSSISFLPTRIGHHELKLEVFSDAAPYGMTDTSTIILSGFAIPADTTNNSINIETGKLLSICGRDTLDYIISNNGNVISYLTDIELITDNLIANFLIEPLKPTAINPGQTITLQIEVIPILAKQGSLEVHSTINDTIFNVETADFTFQIDKLSLVQPESFNVIVGDTVWLQLRGKIPPVNDYSSDIKITLDLNMRNLYFIGGLNGRFKITTQKSTIELPIAINQSLNKVEIKTMAQIDLSDSVYWEVTLPFFALLGPNAEYDVTYIAHAGNCIMPDSILMKPDIIGNCTQFISDFDFVDEWDFNINISPIPAKDDINLSIDLYRDLEVNFSIFDQSGKICKEFLKFPLKKGKHSLIFEIYSLPSGVYIFSVQTQNILKNRMFIITK